MTMRLTADLAQRTITGMMLPFGEVGRTNIGGVTASADHLPEISSDIVLNLEHERARPLGRNVGLPEVTDEGIVATFSIAETTAGNDLLAEVAAGLRTGLSVEIDQPVVRAGQLFGGTLVACAAVVAPAFASARVMTAADVGDLPEDFPEWRMPGTRTSEESETVVVDGRQFLVKTTSTTETTVDEVTPSGDEPEETPAPGASGETNQGDSPDTEEDHQMSGTIVAGQELANDTAPADQTLAPAFARVMQGGLAGNKATQAAHEPTFNEITHRLAGAYAEGGARGLQAALSDIVPSNLGGVGQPAYLGELWSGKAHQRRFVPLFTHGELTSVKGVAGWRWVTKPTVATWAGGKTPVPSAAVSTEAVTATPKRLAGAHDVDRIYRDFQDTEFFESYYRAMTESYSRLSDLAALADAVAGATTVSSSAAGIPTDTPRVYAQLVDGAIAVLTATDGPPTFAILGMDLWRELLLVPSKNVIEYLSSTLGLEEGELDKFRLVPSAAASLTGKVLVGAQPAMTFHELPGVPIRAEALDMVNGGIDGGLFGYYTTVIHDDAGLALVERAA